MIWGLVLAAAVMALCVSVARFIARRLDPLRCVECGRVLETDSISQVDTGLCDPCLAEKERP